MLDHFPNRPCQSDCVIESKTWVSDCVLPTIGCKRFELDGRDENWIDYVQTTGGFIAREWALAVFFIHCETTLQMVHVD